MLWEAFILKGLTDFEVYKLLDSLNLIEAACLIVGASPSEIRDSADNMNDFDWHNRFYLNTQSDARKHFPLVLNALIRSIELKKINASKAIYYVINDHETDMLDPQNSYIEKPVLIDWLKQRGVYPEALFPLEPDNEILNGEHPFYSNKLALIVEAWQQLKYAELSNQTVKNYLESWIKENSPKYGFDSMGDTAISNLAEIVNFEKGGKRITGILVNAFDLSAKQYIGLSKKQPNKQRNNTNSSVQINEGDLPF